MNITGRDMLVLGQTFAGLSILVALCDCLGFTLIRVADINVTWLVPLILTAMHFSYLLSKYDEEQETDIEPETVGDDKSDDVCKDNNNCVNTPVPEVVHKEPITTESNQQQPMPRPVPQLTPQSEQPAVDDWDKNESPRQKPQEFPETKEESWENDEDNWDSADCDAEPPESYPDVSYE